MYKHASGLVKDLKIHLYSTAVLMGSVLTHENAWLHFTKWLPKQQGKWVKIARLLAWLQLCFCHSDLW